jgi:hypothetical protein
MEAIRSSVTSGTTLRTTRHHIPEDNTLLSLNCSTVLKTTEFWDVMPCSLIDHYQCFGEPGGSIFMAEVQHGENGMVQGQGEPGAEGSQEKQKKETVAP